MTAEMGSYQLVNGRYDIMIKVLEEDGSLFYWAQRVARADVIDINHIDDLLESAIAEALQYKISLETPAEE